MHPFETKFDGPRQKRMMNLKSVVTVLTYDSFERQGGFNKTVVWVICFPFLFLDRVLIPYLPAGETMQCAAIECRY